MGFEQYLQKIVIISSHGNRYFEFLNCKGGSLNFSDALCIHNYQVAINHFWSTSHQ